MVKICRDASRVQGDMKRERAVTSRGKLSRNQYRDSLDTDGGPAQKGRDDRSGELVQTVASRAFAGIDVYTAADLNHKMLRATGMTNPFAWMVVKSKVRKF